MLDIRLVERAIIANRPGEPFVLVERSPALIDSLDSLDWQAGTDPPAWEEAFEWAQVLGVEEVRQAKCDEILAELARTDWWAVRHMEDGISLTEERVAYREQLRELRRAVVASDDPGSLTLPNPPPFVPGS